MQQTRKKQHLTPLYTSSLDFFHREMVPFYSPGHKNGRTFNEEFKSSIAGIDLNNLPGTDTLHCPSGPILEAEILLAEAYGVKKSFILVGGSSLGNIASILVSVSPGDKVLVQRNTHKSIIAGIIHSGALPIWINPVEDPIFSIGHGISLDALEKACVKHSDAKAVILLNPTYFGTAGDIKAFISCIHNYGMIAIVDQAHGAHFHFHPELPLGAEDGHADFIVQSFHKTLSSLSQAAVLHLNSSRISEEAVRRVLQTLQTTSPSFPIMASIDLARKEMALEGKQKLENLLRNVEETRNSIKQIPGLKMLDRPTKQKGSGFYDLDITKLLIQTTEWGISGYSLMKILSEKYFIQPELAGPSYVLCILSIGNTMEDLDRLSTALHAIYEKRCLYAAQSNEMQDLDLNVVFNLTSELVFAPRDAFYAPFQLIELHKSIGMVCSEIVTPYPPGIPILIPGERISKEIIEYLENLRDKGYPVSCSDPALKTICIMKCQ